MLFSEAGGCSKHFFGVRCSFGHPMEGFQSFFPNFVTHQILLCTPKLKRPRNITLEIQTMTLLDVKKDYNSNPCPALPYSCYFLLQQQPKLDQQNVRISKLPIRNPTFLPVDGRPHPVSVSMIVTPKESNKIWRNHGITKENQKGMPILSN